LFQDSCEFVRVPRFDDRRPLSTCGFPSHGVTS
jgi:hypothetical protein